jgi:hypothetical protein
LNPAASKILAVTQFAYQGRVQCDAKGNLFFYGGSTPTDSVIYDLLADGSHSLFWLTDKVAREDYCVSFRLDRDGKVWLLAGDEGDNPVVFEFREDGTSPTATKLDAPEDLKALTIQNFIVLQSRTYLGSRVRQRQSIKKRGERARLSW